MVVGGRGKSKANGEAPSPGPVVGRVALGESSFPNRSLGTRGKEPGAQRTSARRKSPRMPIVEIMRLVTPDRRRALRYAFWLCCLASLAVPLAGCTSPAEYVRNGF